MRQNPHVRICGGPGSATTLVYPTPNSARKSRGLNDAPGPPLGQLPNNPFQLADVSGPRMMHETAEGGLSKLRDPKPLCVVGAQEVSQQFRNILLAGTQGWNDYVHHVQAIEQPLGELVRRDTLQKIGRARCNNTRGSVGALKHFEQQ